MTTPQTFGKIADDRLSTDPTMRGHHRFEGSPILSGETGFILSAVGVLLFFGMMLGALATTALVNANGCGM